MKFLPSTRKSPQQIEWKQKFFLKGKDHTEGNDSHKSLTNAFLLIDLKTILSPEGHSQVFLKSMLSAF